MRLLVGSPALARDGPVAGRVLHEVADVRRLVGVVLLPEPVGAAEIPDPALGGDPGSGEDEALVSPRQELRRPLDHRGIGGGCGGSGGSGGLSGPGTGGRSGAGGRSGPVPVLMAPRLRVPGR